MTIRPASTDDLDAVCAVLAHLPRDGPRGIDPEAAARAMPRILSSPGRVLLVAERDGDIVATTDLIMLANLTHDARPYANVENVVVVPDARGIGIGRAIVERAVALAREYGCYNVQLTSNVERTPAHELYESIGFESSAVGYRLYF